MPVPPVKLLEIALVPPAQMVSNVAAAAVNAGFANTVSTVESLTASQLLPVMVTERRYSCLPVAVISETVNVEVFAPV